MTSIAISSSIKEKPKLFDCDVRGIALRSLILPAQGQPGVVNYDTIGRATAIARVHADRAPDRRHPPYIEIHVITVISVVPDDRKIKRLVANRRDSTITIG